MALVLALFSLLLGQNAQAFYNPTKGVWPSRDPLGELVFFKDQLPSKTLQIQKYLKKEASLSSYLFVINNPESKVDYLGMTFWENPHSPVYDTLPPTPKTVAPRRPIMPLSAPWHICCRPVDGILGLGGFGLTH